MHSDGRNPMPHVFESIIYKYLKALVCHSDGSTLVSKWYCVPQTQKTPSFCKVALDGIWYQWRNKCTQTDETPSPMCWNRSSLSIWRPWYVTGTGVLSFRSDIASHRLRKRLVSVRSPLPVLVTCGGINALRRTKPQAPCVGIDHL